MKKLISLLSLLLVNIFLFAQGDTGGGGIMRGHHKLPVVVAVVGIILTVIFVFLFSIERRLRRLEGK